MRSPVFISLFFAATTACSEYNINNKDEVNSEPATEDPIPEPGEDIPQPDEPEEIEEECNGVDDDGDGEIDEGFPDTDFDGVPDCLDEDCALASVAGGEALIDEDCATPDIEITDPWNVNIEWQYTVSAGVGVIVMPAIGNITDDNGDGVIDENDNPDIVFTTWDYWNFSNQKLVALHGDGSGTIFEMPGFDGNAGVAIADVDNDGEPEIIASTTNHEVAAVSHNGTIEWTSMVFPWQMYPQPTVADLDNDGDIEIIFDIAVVDGATGSTISTLPSITSSWRAPAIADLDADGNQEILLGEHVYDQFGNIQWSVPRHGDSTFSAVADIDGDIGGESFWVAGNQFFVYDDDGTQLRSIGLNPGSSRPGPPCVADFDGDGMVEIAIPASAEIQVYAMDGTMLWSASIQDSSGIAGCSGYDVNGDGAYEVLYTDEVILRIFDGATGTVLYSNTSHSSQTLWEYPVVADVDNDGSAEIVIASNGDIWKGITVLGHAGDGWAKSGPTWPLHDFAVSNISPDGSIPSPTPLSWQVHNVYRARPTVDSAATDLSIDLTDICFSGCIDESHVELSIQVSNHGVLPTASDIPVALYSLDNNIQTLLEVQIIPGEIAAGTQSNSLHFTLQKGDIGGGGLVIQVDDDGSGQGLQTECDESNNSVAHIDVPC